MKSSIGPMLNGGGRGSAAVEAEERLTALIEEGLTVPGAVQIAAPFMPALISNQPTLSSGSPERGVQAILLYGSALWNATRDQTSQPDFIVVVDDLRSWYRRPRDRVWGAVLPPAVHCLRVDGALAKVSVVTARQLASQTAVTAKDLHLAGRLSKRVTLVWTRDPQARQRIVDAKRASLKTVARLTLGRFGGSVALDDFLLALLGLSYESEVRIVEPGKIAALLDVERDHYRAVGRALLGALGATPLDDAATRFELAPGVAATHGELQRCLRRSRRRAYLRWPKYLVTYDGWLEYLLQKLARSGTPVSLTERQRRHPLIFALPVLYQMMRTKRVG